ncbi:uncharacterized protein LOC117966563 isoform X1 [Acipenser ruthenus]|uniref:uncharacterized protein LOC117966563 isoform X1 n=2 Tax=Acipenser ruthenus TaxID=7906 RepID=UPI0027414950|nr:uncharacterized protein LOC117966563 isoform X1 [Acipenser ruthenus]
MEKKTKDHIIDTLDDLDDNGLNRFKDKLGDTSFQGRRIAKGKLEHAKSVEVACLIMSTFTETHAAANTIAVLNAINQAQLAEQLKEKVKAAPPPKKRTKSPCADNIGTVKVKQKEKYQLRPRPNLQEGPMKDMNGAKKRSRVQLKMARKIFSKRKRLANQIAKYTSHNTFLEWCLLRDVIPPRFLIKSGAHINVNDPENIYLQNILRECSIKSMRVENTKWIRRISEVGLEIKKTNESYSNLMPLKLTQMIKKIDNFEKNTLNHLNDRKYKEFLQLLSTHMPYKILKNQIPNDNCVTEMENFHLDMAAEDQWHNDNNENKILEIEKDAKSFFRCLSTVLYGTQNNHTLLRCYITKHMSRNKNKSRFYIDEDSRKRTEKMKSSSSGIEAEIVAAADLLNRPIHIHMNTVAKECIKYEGTETSHPCNKEPVNLLYRNNHFELITPKCNNNRYTSNVSTANSQNQGKKQIPAHVRKKMPDRDLGKASNNINNDGVPKNKVMITKGQEVDTGFNSSDKTVTVSQEALKRKGNKFVPEKKYINKDKLMTDLNEWERRRRQAEYFNEETLTESEQVGEHGIQIKRNCHMTPPDGRDTWLDIYIEDVRKGIVRDLKKKGKLNLTKHEEEELHESIGADSISIRPADKGSGIVIINTVDNMKAVETEMQNINTCEEEKANYINNIKELRILVERLHKNGFISKELKNDMLPQNPRTGLVRGNPKMHKDKPPMRMIVSTTDNPTYIIAEIAEKQLQPHVESLPSYVKDTTQFLKRMTRIKTKLAENAILFCMDVKSLNPSVPRHEALEPCKEALDNGKEKAIIPTGEILNMTKAGLENCCFTLFNKSSKQNDGTVTGSKLGMHFASTYVGKWEEMLLSKLDKKPFEYIRYVDDIFGIWTHGEQSLFQFHKVANNIHPNISVDLRWTKSEIEFLDTLVKLDQGSIKTYLYWKPTDMHQHLHASSAHPIHT